LEISIESLSKIYPNGNKALDDINLNIGNGIFGLLGPNGAGKSSLMRILVTLMKPSAGKVTVNGMDLQRRRGEIRRLLGYLPQDFRYFPKLRTSEFLDYMAALSGMRNRRRRREAIDRILEEVGLFEARDKMASKLSGGMKRRLGIAQALIHEPKILIVDEPTTGLDPEERIRFRNLLSDISTGEVIIILSTHIVGDISSTCNHMTLLNRGQVAFTGSPEELIRQARGYVWQIMADDEEYARINEKFPVISTVPGREGWAMQVVAKDVKGYDAEPVEPNLEHAYVHFMENVLKEKVEDESYA
jgi:ABC-type multidrug transport system ATPase subunit